MQVYCFDGKTKLNHRILKTFFLLLCFFRNRPHYGKNCRHKNDVLNLNFLIFDKFNGVFLLLLGHLYVSLLGHLYVLRWKLFNIFWIDTVKFLQKIKRCGLRTTWKLIKEFFFLNI